MSSRFVLANIKMPIEITPDNTIKPLQHLSNIYVVSIIDSITDITIDRSLPDVITQANNLFQTRVIESPQISCSPEPELEPEPEPTRLWIRPEDLHKSAHAFKQNTTFKNRGKYNHRSTSKYRNTT